MNKREKDGGKMEGTFKGSAKLGEAYSYLVANGTVTVDSSIRRDLVTMTDFLSEVKVTETEIGFVFTAAVDEQHMAWMTKTSMID
jgi:hypothetical protein